MWSKPWWTLTFEGSWDILTARLTSTVLTLINIYRKKLIANTIGLYNSNSENLNILIYIYI